VQTTPGPGVIRRVTFAAVAVSLAVVASAAAQPAVPTPPASSAATPAAPVMSRDWKRLRTPNLTVVGNAGAGELRRVATEIERFRLALGAFAPAMRLDSPLPTTVVVFSDDRAFTPFKPRERGRPMPFIAGYFSPLPEEHRIVMSGTGRREFTFHVIFHEYTHLLVDQNVRRLPLWLHEGLAEFYSTFSGSEQDGRTIIGRPIEWRVATLASSTPLPLAKLTSPAALGELLRDPVATDRFYATAWALTHYLMVGEGGALRPKLLAFLKACESGQDAGVAFKGVFGEDLTPLDKRVEAHVMKLQLSAIQLPTTTVDIPLAPEPMLETDAQQIRADLLVRQGAHDEAAPYLARALQIDPQHVGARLTKARSLLAQERAADALDLVSAPDLAESPRFDAALVRADALRETAHYADAVSAYQRAIGIQPEAPAAYYGLTLAQMALDNKTAAAAFTRCLTLRPGAEWYFTRELDALRIGIDTYVVSDAYNYIRLQGWQNDASSYAMIAAALTQRRLKKLEDAAGTVREIASHRKPDDWVMAIVGFLDGKLTGDALIARAKGDGQLTEARAYVGIIASIDGDVATATRHLEWVKASGRKDYSEYGLAIGELKRLARRAPPAVP
jgi:tetratricopeptide (TPR) repeat protein